MKNKIIAVVVVAALLGGGALLLGNKSQRHAHEMGPTMMPVVVETKLLTVGHTRLTLPVVADVLALRDNMLSSRLSAYVTALPLFEGAHFKRGDLLARLDVSPTGSQGQANSLDTELAAAESNLKTEQERLRRAQALYEIQGVSQEQFQSAEAALATARSRYTVAKENLHSATIIAPFNGVVSQRLVQPGDLVTPGKQLLKITDTSYGNRLLVNVPEAVQPTGLRVGDQMLPLTPWPEAGPQGLRRYEARSMDGSLLPGSRIDAQLIVFRSAEAVLLPRECLLNDDGHTATVLALRENGVNKGAMGEMPAQTPMHQEHQPEHQMQGDHTQPGMKLHAAPEGRHHQKTQTAGEIETIQVTIAAQGEEGSVAADATLAGRRVVCASPDILSRLVAGAPFSIQAAKE
jgi:pyruvate/2-oxoglutarate dehydrogenase complex dihydrolipoamide acyltransferase (E2) component